MRIVIDLQGAQTESRFRGIGRYSLSLAQAIVRNRGEHEVFIALNGLFPETIEPIRATFDGLLPQENICIWQSPGPVCESESGNAWRRKAAERIREKLLELTNQELPHATAVITESWHERADGLIEIEATILVDRESQKPIVIGRGGQLLKRVGTEARLELERSLNRRVFVRLWVKVRKNWRDDDRTLRELGLRS